MGDKGGGFIRRLTFIDRALLAAAGALFLWVCYQKYAYGWLRPVDLYLLGAAGTLLLSVWLPLVLKANLLVFLALIVGAEGVFYVANQLAPHRELRSARLERVEGGGVSRHADGILGYSPTLNTTVMTERRRDGKRLFASRYTIDERGRRTIPLPNLESRKNSILFFGCSLMFGEGVNDDETLPFQVGRLAPEHRPYNYAFNGYGPQHMLAKLQQGDIESEVAGSGRQLVYVFIDDHVKRAISSMRTVWVHRSPYYFIDAEDRLTRDGTFNSARPHLYRFYHDILLKSQTLTFFDIDFPLFVRERDLALTARIIEASFQEFRRRFRSDEFLVVIYPVGAEELGGRLAQYLHRAGIKHFDYSGKIPWSDEFFLDKVYDAHPNGKANLAVARRLVQDLGIGAESDATDRISRK